VSRGRGGGWGHIVGGDGGEVFVAAIAGWYLLAAIMFVVMDLPVRLPVFDLSMLIKGWSQMEKEREKVE